MPSVRTATILIAVAFALTALATPSTATYSDGECWETGNGYGCNRAQAECGAGMYVFVYGETTGWNMVCVQWMQ